MKLRGVSFIDQYIEKIVVAVFAVILLLVLASQFLLQPNKIDVGGTMVPPENVFESLEVKARELEGKLNTTAPEMPAPLELDLYERYENRRAGNVVPRTTLAYSGFVPEFAEGEFVGSSAGARVAVGQAVISPEAPVAVATLSTLDPFQVATVAGLSEALGGIRQPMDVVGVSVEAALDIQKLIAQLEADPDGAGEIQPMPTSWWRRSLEVFGVALERQELLTDGTWSDAVSIETLPGFTNLLKSVQEEEVVTRAILESYATQAAELSSDIRHPAYFATIAGPKWEQPSVAFASLNDSGSNVPRQLQTRRNKLIEDRRQKLASAGRDSEEPWLAWWDRPEDQRDPQLPSIKPEPTGANVNTGETTTTPPSSAKAPVKLTRQQRGLFTHEKNILTLEEQLWDTGWRPEGLEDDGGVVLDEKLALLRNSQSVTVWKHDMTAQPGRTYRYRLAVIVNNPAFERGTFLSEDQAEIATQPLLTGEFSVWTAPIEPPSTRYYFATGAQEGGAGVLNATQASFEVFEFFYGYYRKSTATLQPGERLYATAKLPEGLLEFDISDVKPETQAPEELRDPRDSGSGGGDVVPTGERQSLPVASNNDEPERTGTAITNRRDITLSVLLLDVSRAISGNVEAVVLGEGGRVLRLNPKNEKIGDLYSRVSDSAREGQTQGKPKPAKKRPIREIKRPPPRDPGGGGGGGGGGSGAGGG